MDMVAHLFSFFWLFYLFQRSLVEKYRMFSQVVEKMVSKMEFETF